MTMSEPEMPNDMLKVTFGTALVLQLGRKLTRACQPSSTRPEAKVRAPRRSRSHLCCRSAAFSVAG